MICAVAVNLVLLLKLPLFLTRQLSPLIFLHRACPQINTSEEAVPQQYVFTMVVYSSLYVGRCLEAIVFHIHLFHFLFKQETIKPLKIIELCKKRWRQKIKKRNDEICSYVQLVSLGLFSLILVLSSLSVPVLGLVSEAKHGSQHCDRYIYEHHFVYWILDIVRYLHDVVIRMLMIIATIAIGQLWSSTDNESENVPDDTECEPKNHDMYLKDREITSEDHRSRMQKYILKGGQVERTLDIFETWFIIPWILFFLSSSLDSEYILKYLRDSSSKNDSIGDYDFTEIHYMVYNFNQVFLLAVAFICSKMINEYHQNYYNESRYQQLKKFKTASRKAMASMNNIESEDNFDFVPRIWGSSIKIKVDNPLYVIILLVSAFFAIADGLI